MACLAWAHLGNTAAALEGMRRHEPLTAAWAAEQQQLVFDSMLSVLKQKDSDDSPIQVTQHVWEVAVRNRLPNTQLQLRELVTALLSPNRLPMALQVSITLASNCPHAFLWHIRLQWFLTQSKLTQRVCVLPQPGKPSALYYGVS